MCIEANTSAALFDDVMSRMLCIQIYLNETTEQFAD